ncbi:MAG: ATP-binding cassette domain-containing protein [Thermoguttaceae bacterium]|nr:ATP-binding cassette domain-containing protein [Thermoguttaceae bacterium]
MAVILTASHLRKHFGPEPVLSDVSFQIREGDKIGLIGPNGCGKTTLLNILAGREESERGEIEKPNDVLIGYLEQRPQIAEGVTLRQEARSALEHLYAIGKEAEQIAERLANEQDPAEHERLARRFDRIHEELARKDAYNLDYRIDRILHGVGFTDEEFDRPASSFSGGELNRLGLAKLLLAEPEIMLLDEPSNHLDLAATEWLEQFLAASSAAVVLVSHDRYFLDRVTNRTLELYFGTVDEYPGNFSKYTTLKDERLLVQTRTYEKYVEEVEKAKDFIRRHHYGMKAGQAEDRRKKLARLEEEPVDPPRKISTPEFHFPPASRTGDIVFRVDGLSKGFDHPLFRDLTLTIERGQRWAILGPNGCGKTTLLKCLLKEIEPDSGEVYHGQGIKVGYFDQHLHLLDDALPVVEAIRPEKKIFEDLARRKLLGSFGLTQDQQLQTVASLSGGQRCRAALAKLSANDPNVMILDEPTNHLDLWARAALERAIRSFDGTVLFISHDRYFVDRTADHLLIIQPNARFQVIEGNYSTFRDRVAKGLMADPFLAGALDESRKNPANSAAGPVPQRKEPPKTEPARKNQPKKNPPKKKGSSKPSGPGAAPSRPTPPPVPPKRDYSRSEAQHQWEKELNAGKKAADGAKRKRKFPYRKVSDIEEEIFIRETRVMELNEELLKPEVVRDGEKMKRINQELTEEQEKIKLLYEHWEEASELNW